MKTRFLAVGLFACVPLLSQGASFDCSKAASVTEKLICSEDFLSVLDERLASAYEKALETVTDKEAVKKSQIEWIKKQRTCTEEDCLSQAYEDRLLELDRFLASAPKSSANSSAKYKATVAEHSLYPINPNYPVCKVFADYLNSKYYKPGDCTIGEYPPDNRLQPLKYKPVDVGQYRTQLVERWVKKNSSVPNADAIENGVINTGNVHLWEISVDLDNDGKIDSLLVRRDISKGELASHGCIYLASATSLILTDNGKFVDKWGDVYGEPVVFDKKTYLISEDGSMGYFLYEPYKDVNSSYKVLNLSPMCSVSK